MDLVTALFLVFLALGVFFCVFLVIKEDSCNSGREAYLKDILPIIEPIVQGEYEIDGILDEAEIKKLKSAVIWVERRRYEREVRRKQEIQKLQRRP